MPIIVECGCGKVLTVPDSYAGKWGRCSACNATLKIQASSPIDVEDTEDYVEPLISSRATRFSAASPSIVDRQDDEARWRQHVLTEIGRGNKSLEAIRAEVRGVRRLIVWIFLLLPAIAGILLFFLNRPRLY